MNKKTLAISLSKLKRFENPKEYLEQYESDSEIVAEVLWHLELSGRLADNIADFGAGTGILGIGCLLLGKKVTFIEKDSDAIIILKENLKDFKDYKILNDDVINNQENFDLIITNPPFGTRQKGADKAFLENAVCHSQSILSMHLTVTKPYIKRFYSDKGFSVDFEWDVDFPIKASYSHHKSKVSRKKVSILYAQKSKKAL